MALYASPYTIKVHCLCFQIRLWLNRQMGIRGPAIIPKSARRMALQLFATLGSSRTIGISHLCSSPIADCVQKTRHCKIVEPVQSNFFGLVTYAVVHLFEKTPKSQPS